jgi:bacterioferritin (cytochrome b1)
VVTPPGGGATTSRRALLRGSGLGLAGTVAAVALEACGGSSHQPTVHKIPPEARNTDVEILNRLLDIEYKAIAAYTAVIPLLAHHAREAAKQFLHQEITHSGEVYALIRQADGHGDKPQPSYDLGHPQTHRDILELLHTVEQEQITGYLEAIPNVSPGTVRAALAAILANDAQHLSVIRLALHEDPLPSALVTGNE